MSTPFSPEERQEAARIIARGICPATATAKDIEITASTLVHDVGGWKVSIGLQMELNRARKLLSDGRALSRRDGMRWGGWNADVDDFLVAHSADGPREG